MELPIIQHALGIPDAYIMQRGGWGNDGTFKTVYRHALKGRSNEMREPMQNGMQNGTEKSP